MPPRILNDTKKFLEDNDPISAFLSNKCDITHVKEDMVQSSTLFESFNDFYKGEKKINVKNFKKNLNKHDIDSRRKKNGVYYVGLKFKEYFQDDLDCDCKCHCNCDMDICDCKNSCECDCESER
jgi:hypothetical protein